MCDDVSEAYLPLGLCSRREWIVGWGNVLGLGRFILIQITEFVSVLISGQVFNLQLRTSYVDASKPIHVVNFDLGLVSVTKVKNL